jgi:deazaflavin-dependent oxidoreductase (nitroreductase family)
LCLPVAECRNEGVAIRSNARIEQISKGVNHAGEWSIRLAENAALSVVTGATRDSRRETRATGEAAMSDKRGARVPPRWVIRLAWATHRGAYRLSGGRIGLWRPRPGRWGALRLTTHGRRTGRQRSVILGYFEDGADLVTMAMNGWGDGEPAWWLNLQAHPDAAVDLAGGPRPVRGRAAVGDVRARVWERWRAIDGNLDGYAALRSTETAVVILEPRAP